MKTAVSIPDDVFEAADRLAKRRQMSRSALYAEALRQMLVSEVDAGVTARLDAVYAHDDPGIGVAVAAAQAQAVREDW